MKTIASLTGPEYLRACNKSAHAVADYFKNTKILDLRKILPEIPEGATEEEKEKIFADQGKKNLVAMLDRAMTEEADETWKLIQTLVLPEPGEELDGYDVMIAAMEIVTTPKVMDFFIKLMKSALKLISD